MPPPKEMSALGHPDVAGWVLGALDHDDAEHFAKHLPSCEECQAAVAALGPVARLLQNPVAEGNASAARAPAELASRTLRRVEWAARLADTEAAEVTPRVQADASAQAAGRIGASRFDVRQPEPQQEHPEPDIKAAEPENAQTREAVKIAAWRRTGIRAVSLGAAAAAAIGIGVAVWASPADTPLAFKIALHAAHGGTAAGQAQAYHTQNGWSIRLTVHGLKVLARGRFYECWYASPSSQAGAPDFITAGTFTVGHSGSAAVQMWSAADPRSFPTMQITAEQPGGSGQHGRVILSGSVSH